jgi:tetratricopeptide (TPR) repeat protein
MTSARGDRGILPDFQAALATTLADLGKLDEAERLALEARANGSPDDTSCKIASTMALAAVRAAQGRDDEAEELFRSTLGLARDGNFEAYEIEPLERYSRFLRDRGREDDAASHDSRLAELSPPTLADGFRSAVGGQGARSAPPS